MAVAALTAAYVSLNGGATINDHVKSVTLTVDVNELDVTAMGDSWKDVIGGVKSATLAIEYFDDVAASKVDAVLWPLLGTVVAFEIRLSDAIVGTDNPKYTGSVLVKPLSIGGSHGATPMKSLSMPVSGVVTRATS